MLENIPVEAIGVVIIGVWLAIFAVYVRSSQQNESLQTDIEALQKVLDDMDDGLE